MKRLVVCLDGTWNVRDSGTNVFHQHTLTLEASPSPPGVEQRRYYDEGVGTSPLDNISGGGFGFGLEKNVREAYNWLVENFDANDDGSSADEIYMFGFSRGAYTARSLVGFIGCFGILRRGAPISCEQLWSSYCQQGRQRERRSSLADKLFGDRPNVMHEISDLVADPWYIAAVEDYYKKHAEEQRDPDHVHGQVRIDLTPDEKLLVRWSRRAKITYLGIYDTVGAIGWDALAIPGLESKLSMHHNMRPTSLVEKCRHALAIDEHRSSFRYTPFLAYTNHEPSKSKSGSVAPEDWLAADPTPEEWKKIIAAQESAWNGRIEQRWFVGAHSNVGGGYASNTLAQGPLGWIMEGAGSLEYRGPARPNPQPGAQPGSPVDSYSEFAPPIWTKVARAKRFYRQIEPTRQLHGPVMGNDGSRTCGHTTNAINVTVDPVALARCAKSKSDYVPPNIVGYARRKLKEQTANGTAFKQITAIAGKSPEYDWLGSSMAEYIALGAWSISAAVGLLAVFALLGLEPSVFGVAKDAFAGRISLLLMIGIAVFAPIVDFSEGFQNFKYALGDKDAPEDTQVRRRAFLDSIVWTRGFGVVLAVIGLLYATVRIGTRGWYADEFSDAIMIALQLCYRWSPVVLFAAFTIVILRIILKRTGSSIRAAVTTFMTTLSVVALAVVATTSAGYFLHFVLRPVLNPTGSPGSGLAARAHYAGSYLFLLWITVYFADAFLHWVGEPMKRVNLPSIVPLQLRKSAPGVATLLGKWSELLRSYGTKDKAVDEESKQAMVNAVRESIWRDLWGFILLYTMVLAYAAWFTLSQLQLPLILGIPEHKIPVFLKAYSYAFFWIGVPLVGALLDIVEDSIHLYYLRLYKAGRIHELSSWLVRIALIASIGKFVTFGIGLVWLICGVVIGTVSLGQGTGWRGTVGLTVTYSFLLGALVLLVSALIYRLKAQATCPKVKDSAKKQSREIKASLNAAMQNLSNQKAVKP